MKTLVDQMTLVTGILKIVGDANPNLPMTSRHFNAITQAATKLSQELTPYKEALPDIGIQEWATTDDVGNSSKFLAFKLTGSGFLLTSYEHPYDAGDFIRCCKLFASCPGLIDELPRMAKESKVWAGLVEDWDLICKHIKEDDDESTKAYELITKNH
jgi:hypothetical protein